MNVYYRHNKHFNNTNWTVHVSHLYHYHLVTTDHWLSCVFAVFLCDFLQGVKKAQQMREGASRVLWGFGSKEEEEVDPVDGGNVPGRLLPPANKPDRVQEEVCHFYEDIISESNAVSLKHSFTFVPDCLRTRQKWPVATSQWLKGTETREVFISSYWWKTVCHST